MAIRTRIRVTARSQSEAKSIASQIRTVVRGGEVYVEGPRSDDDVQWSASIYAMVPRKSDLRVGTRNGPLSVEDVRGDMDLQTSNGPLTLRDLAGSVRARTSMGCLRSLSMDPDGMGQVSACTTNGPLTISVPDGYNARLETGTTNGPVSLGFPMTVARPHHARYLDKSWVRRGHHRGDDDQWPPHAPTEIGSNLRGSAT